MDSNPLNNREVNGNTMAWMAHQDMDRRRSDDGDEPGVVCDSCGETVLSSEICGHGYCDYCKEDSKDDHMLCECSITKYIDGKEVDR